MDCPVGKKYSPILKMCISKNAFPASKGHSKSPCPDGRLWNAFTRKCIRPSLYKKMYGSPKKHSLKTPAPKPVSVTPVKSRPDIIPSGRGSLQIVAANPRKNTFMESGLSRKHMLQWLGENCNNQEDPFSLAPFEEMEDFELASMVKLGSGFCYPFNSLDTHMKSSIERGIPIKNIMNPSYRLDNADYGAIQKVGKRINKTYKLPKIVVAKPAPNYKLYIDKGDTSDFKFVFLFDETKVKVKANGTKEYGTAIPDGGWLGYIPLQGTENLERLIKEAFKKGQLFTTSKPPFDCCKFHIKKNKDYWKDNTVAKIKALEAEIKNYV
jgi:hypothetical protein